MTKFIEKIDFQVDVQKMINDLDQTLSEVPWPEKKIVTDDRVYHANQIGLNYRIHSEYPWYDASGSLYDKELKHFTGRETDFTEWNPVGEYTKNQLLEFSKYIESPFGRIRYMRLMPRCGLSIHTDFEERYHLVLKTNPNALFGEFLAEEDLAAKCYHIPADGNFYKVDTTRPHFVYNGGWEPRIHLVICRIK